jgi:hypothetical protein
MTHLYHSPKKSTKNDSICTGSGMLLRMIKPEMIIRGH